MRAGHGAIFGEPRWISATERAWVAVFNLTLGLVGASSSGSRSIWRFDMTTVDSVPTTDIAIPDSPFSDAERDAYALDLR